MTNLHTTFLAAFLAVTAGQAVADPIIIDLPRLEFPTAPQTTRTAPDSALPVALLVQGN